MPPSTDLVIVINSGLEASLDAARLSTWEADLATAGYTVVRTSWSGGTVADLRSHLASFPNLKGAILVGDLPVAWYKLYCWGSWDEFATDLYYMDLNGVWADSDSDGVFDGRSGDLAAEIWVSRLAANTCTWESEVTLIHRYLDRLHTYRTGGLSVPRRGITFIDDDWSYWRTVGMEQMYGTSVTTMTGEDHTVATEYTTKFAYHYENLLVCAHSYSGGHHFKDPYTGDGGWVYSSDVRNLTPQSLFYNLFACSGGRYTYSNYLAGWYVFGQGNGLTCISTTKTGSMLYFEDFYGPQASGACMGDAYLSWSQARTEQSPCWFYGMTLIGDGTVLPQSGAQAPAVSALGNSYAPDSADLGAVDVPLLGISFSAGSGQLQGVRCRNEGSCAAHEDITQMKAYLDLDADGAVDAGEPLLGTGTFNDYQTCVIPCTGAAFGGTPTQVLVACDVSSAAGTSGSLYITVRENGACHHGDDTTIGYPNFPLYTECPVILAGEPLNRYVDGSVTSSGDGLSWATALKTVQEGIDAAKHGDHVLVAPGLYEENVRFRGYMITVRSTDPLDPSVVASTIIDGQGLDRAVYFSDGENSHTTLKGFTIRNGYSAYSVGGIYCSKSSPTISNNVITGNSSSAIAGGILCWDCSPVIINNTITGNSARGFGGGIDCHGSGAVIANNVISGNTVEETYGLAYGGGIYCDDGCTAVISNNVISGNTCSQGGGIACVHVSTPTIINNLIFGNTAIQYGGGIYCYQEATPTIENNTIAGNSSETGGGIYCDYGYGYSPIIRNCIVAFSVTGGGIATYSYTNPVVSYCNVYGNAGGEYGGQLADQTGSNGNISVDPLFADAGSDDYHLKSKGGRWDAGSSTWVVDAVHSPCIDVGDPGSDYSSEPLPNGDRINMGTWGNTAEASKADAISPQIEQWAICATHDNGVGEIVTTTADEYAEPRGCGIALLRLTCSEALDPGTVGTGAIAINGVRNGDCCSHVDSLTLLGDACTMELALSPALPDEDTYTMTVATSVCDEAGNPLAGDRDRVLSGLKGDANGDRCVDVGDMLKVRANQGEAVAQATASCDINLDGEIDVGDMLAVRANQGHDAPEPAPESEAPQVVSERCELEPGWYRFSVPVEPAEPSPCEVLSDLGEPRTDWLLFDRVDGRHCLYPQGQVRDFALGRGYWLRMKAAGTVEVTGTLGDAREPFEIELSRGWSIIGCPFNQEMPWDDQHVRVTTGEATAPLSGATRDRSVCPTIYGWVNRAATIASGGHGRHGAFSGRNVAINPLRSSGALEPWQGYLIYAHRPCTLLLSGSASSAGKAASAEERRRPSADDWRINLAATVNGFSDASTTIGVTSGAEPLTEPHPPLGPGVDLYVESAAAAKRGSPGNAVDLRPATAGERTWQLVLETGQPDAPVTISWPDLSELPNDLIPYFVDSTTGRRLYMRTTRAHTFCSGPEGARREFHIGLKQRDTAACMVTAVSAVAADGGGAEIVFTLAADATIEAAVLNLAGRPIKQIAAGKAALSGINRIYWDGRSSNGTKTPSGRYLVRLTARGEDGQVVNWLAPVGLGRW